MLIFKSQVRSLPPEPAYNIPMDEWNREIEKYWRDKFADEIEECLIGLEDDEVTLWFNRGMKHAARIVRYSKDD